MFRTNLHYHLNICPICFVKFVPTKEDLNYSPCRVADRETGPLSLSNVQATTAAGNPVTLFLYIAADAQELEPYKLTLESELIIAAADEIIQLRDKLTNAKQEITQTIRKLEQIYKQIEIKTL